MSFLYLVKVLLHGLFVGLHFKVGFVGMNFQVFDAAALWDFHMFVTIKGSYLVV